MYKGSVGASASANALEQSAPTTIMFFIAAVPQKIRARGCSKQAAYVGAMTMVPLCDWDPFATQRAFFLSDSAFTK